MYSQLPSIRFLTRVVFPTCPCAHDNTTGVSASGFAHEAGAEPWKHDGGLPRWGKAPEPAATGSVRLSIVTASNHY